MRRPTSPPFPIHPAPLPPSACLSSFAAPCIPISSPSLPPILVAREQTNMRRIYPPDLEGVRSLYIIETTNRDATSRDHSDLSLAEQWDRPTPFA